jgi:hypothetical protein
VNALICLRKALPGCSANGGGTNVPRVSRFALQEDIAHRLADAGEKPESVTCKQDLVGEVGATARCDVVAAGLLARRIIRGSGANGLMMDLEVDPGRTRLRPARPSS